MSDELKLIKSKGGTVLLCRGHRYHKHVTNKNGNTLWRCENYKPTKLKCTGSIIVNSATTMIIKDKPHCDICRPDIAHNFIESTINDYCDNIAHNHEPAPRMYKKALAVIESNGWHLATNKPVPTFYEKKSGIYRKRNSVAHVKKIRADTVENVEIPLQYIDFLLADYSCNGIRIIVFASEESRSRLKTLSDFFMDGTYQACPAPFRQLYVIHGDIGSNAIYTNIVPLVFAFMSHQTSEAYTILFDIIKSQIRDWRPRTVTIDFEKAAMFALTKMNIEVNGCYYHFCNAIIRKAKTLGVKKTKINNQIIKLCCNLALLPDTNIEEGWQYIKNEIVLYNALKNFSTFVTYFEKHWLKDGYFKIWCVFGERHRTNNCIEGWNHNLNTNINRNEVQFSQILHILKQESSVTFLNCNRLERFNKNPSPKRRTKTMENDYRILLAQMQLTNGEISIGHFLEKLK